MVNKKKLTLKQIRKLNDRTLADIEKRYNIGSTTWYRYEKNVSEIPASVFLDFCKWNNVDPKEVAL